MLYDKRWTKTVPQIKPVPIEPWRQLLLKAACILERDGWCKGSMYWRTRSCARGAINRAAYGRPCGPEGLENIRGDDIEAVHRLAVAIKAQYPDVNCIEVWNDTRVQDGAEVIRMMRKVAGA